MHAKVTNDLTVLIKSGEPTHEQLEQAWLCVNAEFTETVGDAKTLGYIESANKVTQLAARVVRITSLVESLKVSPDLELIRALKEEAFPVQLDPTNEDDFADDLARVLTGLKADEIEMEELLAIQKIEEQKEENRKNPVTEMQFEETLIDLGESGGTRYRAEELTTLQYAILIKRYLRKIKSSHAGK